MLEITEQELERRAEITASKLDGIQAPHVALYHFSIRYNYERAQNAFQRYDQISPNENNAADLISAAQEAISHCGALSRFFFPSHLGRKKSLRKLHFARAERLRREFSIDDDSPLADREIRNLWEHFDERLDEFLLTNDAGWFYPMPMLGSHILADDPINKIFKLIDIQEHCLVLLDRKFFIGPIRAELCRVFDG